MKRLKTEDDIKKKRIRRKERLKNWWNLGKGD
jgi:hypothetical protein